MITDNRGTARRRAEAELQRLELELEARVRQRTAALQAANQELQDFSYSVSHELRAPLRHINGFAHCLELEAGPLLNPSCRHYLAEIAAAARRMDQLIRDLLRFSLASSVVFKREPVNLDLLVDQSIAELQVEIGRRRILWQRERLPVVPADAALLKQVVLNLLANALKFTRPRNPARIRISATNQNASEVLISIRDNGVGFDPRHADKLFTAFQRLHSPHQFEGVGIGLAHVRRIIARHGGRTWADGRLNVGATFSFTLPRMSGRRPRHP